MEITEVNERNPLEINYEDPEWMRILIRAIEERKQAQKLKEKP